MGIMIAWMAPPDGRAPDPFADPGAIPTTGAITHGHLPEANNHGGAATGLPDPTTLPTGQTLFSTVGIAGFRYLTGDLTLPGALADPPRFVQGQPISFSNLDPGAAVFHTITACRLPCNGSTGISYPLANGTVEFDSGELGYGPPGLTAAGNRASWTVPGTLAPGTYTYFCRIHPFMRGAFRVVPR
jgi:plastocyanin